MFIYRLLLSLLDTFFFRKSVAKSTGSGPINNLFFSSMMNMWAVGLTPANNLRIITGAIREVSPTVDYNKSSRIDVNKASYFR